jgi:hypothetical protein
MAFRPTFLIINQARAVVDVFVDNTTGPLIAHSTVTSMESSAYLLDVNH